MARRFGLMLVTVGVLLPVTSASAAIAPPEAPLLTSLPFASPVIIHWTPATASGGGDGGHGHGHGHGHGPGHSGDSGAPASVQAVLRAEGPCASPATPARAIATFADTTTSDFSDAVADGTYCYSIEVTDATSPADSPGLTVVVDTLPATAVAPGPPITPIGGGMVIQPTSVAAAADLSAPAAPTRLSVSVPRSRPGAARLHVTVRWANPVAADLARVDVVMNSRRPPRDATNGTLVYRGLGTSIVLTMRAGQTRYLALFASDSSGNVSAAARRVVSLASLVPLRPLSGSSVSATPLLTWKATKGASYYNVQLFRNGKRVLVAWPSQSYRLPAGTLLPGTYTWFVWPALEAARATPRFGDLIGRATFVYPGLSLDPPVVGLLRVEAYWVPRRL
ncbi:MAG: hypothetical protein M3Q31_21815 [Actinomycetota bacterium]|nr:hypothetical protein [Actinomycetota bacterium]